MSYRSNQAIKGDKSHNFSCKTSLPSTYHVARTLLLARATATRCVNIQRTTGAPIQMRKSPWLRLRVKEMQQTGPSRPVPLRVWRNGAKVAQTGSSPPQTGGLIMRGNKERRLSGAEGARWQQERREEAGAHRGVRSYLYVGDQTSLHQRHVINTPHKNTSETHELFRLTAGTSRKSPSSVHVLQPHVDTTTTLNHITETFCPNKPFTPDLTAETFVQQIYTELHVAQCGAAVCTQPACVYSQHVSSCAGSQRPSGFLLEKHEDKRMHMKRY